MKRMAFLVIAVAMAAGVVASIDPAPGRADEGAAPIFLKEKPAGYRDWKLISVSHEAGNINSIGAVLANDVAVKAYREGKLPFPDGSIIAAVHYKYVPPKKTTKSSGVTNLSLPGPPQMFSLRLRIRKSMPRQVAGGSVTSTATEHLAMTR